MLRKISKVSEGVRPKKCWKRFRWPDEEIGKNSVTPWVKAKIKLWIKVINYFTMNLTKNPPFDGFEF